MSTTTLAAAPVSTNAVVATSGAAIKTPLSNVFRLKPLASAVGKALGTTTPGVQQAISHADFLVESYSKLKVDVLDRSDRALWSLLEQVYAYGDSVERSPLKRETRQELIKAIQQRDLQSVPTNASTMAVAVRYVFSDQSRQSRNNYTIALEKAAALGVATNEFADFLAEHGGVTKVVEKVFDHEADDLANAEVLAKTLRDDKKSRTDLVGRLYTILAHSAQTTLDYNDVLNNWVPEKPAKKGKAGNKDDTLDPKYEAGRFVLFMSVRNPSTGKYHVVQGNVFDRSFEDQLLGSIAERMGADTSELSELVSELEKQVGFGAVK